MRVLVLLKVVPDTETRIRVAADGRGIEEGDVKWILCPFDEFALEEGLRMVEKAGAGEVVTLTLGDERCQPVLRQALAMGAHRAVLLQDPAFQGGDGIATARALAGAARAIGFDLILAGRLGVGSDRAQVPAMVAELLDLPYVGIVTSIEMQPGKAICRREIEGASEVVETSLPAVLGAQKGLNEPRYASLKGIMAAKKKPIDLWGPAEVRVAAARLGAAGAAEIWQKLELPPPRTAGKVLRGEASAMASELVELLSLEAKVI